MRFLVFDLNNMIKRAQHGKDMRGADKDVFGALCLHISLDTFQYLFHLFEDAHVVCAVDAGSWRYNVFPEYKGKREYDENDEIVRGLIKDFAEYLKTKTAVTLLQHKGAEADDLIARWCQLHQGEEFENIIISGDGDFKQLVSSNTSLYSPNSHYLYTNVGIFEYDHRKIPDDVLTAERYGKTWKVICDKQGEPERFDPEYELFLKCIRGDSSDNIPSAYPRIRETKIKVAYADRGGLDWNNFLNSYWGKEELHSVREQYEINRSLIDLRLIPTDILDQIDETIGLEILKPRPTMIPHHFKQYCARHKLPRIMERTHVYVTMLGKPYPLDQIEGAD
jgi:hypothetical protein